LILSKEKYQIGFFDSFAMYRRAINSFNVLDM